MTNKIDSIHSYKKKDLLELPVRDWNEKGSHYSSLLIVPTRKKHDSGWTVIAIVGVDDKFLPVEIAAYCDDIYWCIAKDALVVEYEGTFDGFVRTDCTYPSGIIHVWKNGIEFEVGASLSSTDVTMHRKAAKSE